MGTRAPKGKQVGTKTQKWDWKGTNCKLGTRTQKWDRNGNKVGTRTQKWDKKGNKVGTKTQKWDRNGNSVRNIKNGTRMRTKWEQEPKAGQEWERVDMLGEEAEAWI